MKSSILATFVLLAAACSTGAPASPSPVPPTSCCTTAPTLAPSASPAPTAVPTSGSTAGYSCDPDMAYGCNASPSAGTPAPSPVGTSVVITQSTGATPHFLGPTGNALYTFDNDTTSTSACGTGCTDTWPPLTVQAGAAVQAGGHEEDFATLARTDGSLQLTYYGKPLYYYAGDASATDVNGDGLFGKWHLAIVQP